MKMDGSLHPHFISAAVVFVTSLLMNSLIQTETRKNNTSNLNSSDLISNRGYTIDDCTCVCGKSNEYENGEIVGGVPAIPAEFPWIVALFRDKDKFFCAGTLITRLHVMTAAHCLEGITPQEITVVLGEYDRENPMESNTEIRRLISGVQHKNFNLVTFDNDIAILQLDASVDFTPNIRVACLPDIGEDKFYAGKRGTTAGWGKITEGGDLSDVLRKVDLPIMDKKSCLRLAEDEPITNNMICTGYPEGKKDACTGDSGGPMHLNGKVIGIVSWGDGCARPNTPGVFAKVVNYLDWIKSHIGEQCLCSPSGRGRN